MRVIRSTYGGAAAWRTQRRALQEARCAAPQARERPGVGALEPAVVVSGPDEHGEGAGVLVEAVVPDGTAVYRHLIPEDGRGAGPEEAIEAAIQEAWRQLVRHVGPPDGAEHAAAPV